MPTVREIHIDDILETVGGFGTFQFICLIAFCIMIIPATFQVLITNFVALKPRWRCLANSSKCTLNGTYDGSENTRCSIGREEWEFIEPKDFSIVTQFDIYCEHEWLLDLSTGIFFLGAVTGGILFGTLADRKGRKFVLFLSLCFLIGIGLVSVASPNIYFFIASRYLSGSCYTGALAMMIIMVAELVESKRRSLASNIVWIFYALAFCILSLKAYFIRKWKILMIVSTAPYLLVVIFIKVIPESIRWLMMKERFEEIKGIFEIIANINGRTFLPDDMKVEVREVDLAKGSSYKDLFIPYSFGLKTLIQAYGWFVTSMVYYGISLASDELGGSMYLNFALISLMECPGNIMGAYFCNWFGRKKTAAIPMLMASVACILIPFVPTDGNLKIARVVCGMIGKYFITISYSCLYLWSAEIFPTNNRAKGIGFMQIFEMIGGACAPFIAKELFRVSKIVPFLIFGIFSIIGSLLLIFLPETKGRSMDA